jgi:hypothetical protein
MFAGCGRTLYCGSREAVGRAALGSCRVLAAGPRAKLDPLLGFRRDCDVDRCLRRRDSIDIRIVRFGAASGWRGPRQTVCDVRHTGAGETQGDRTTDNGVPQRFCNAALVSPCTQSTQNSQGCDHAWVSCVTAMPCDRACRGVSSEGVRKTFAIDVISMHGRERMPSAPRVRKFCNCQRRSFRRPSVGRMVGASPTRIRPCPASPPTISTRKR